MHTVLKPAQLRWTGQVIRMPGARLPKLEETLERHSQSLSEGFRNTNGSWEQTAQEQSKLRCLINEGAALYEKKKENL